MNDVTQGHTVHAYNDELAQLRSVVLDMGKLVVDQAKNAVKALCENDEALSDSVVERDRQVDQFDMEADEEVVRVLALRQPVAMDLRLVLALSKVASELAQAGNKAKKIAHCSAHLSDDQTRMPHKKLLRHVRLMNERAYSMLERSLEALAKVDVKAAIAVVKEDDELDQEFDAGMRHLVTFVWDNPSTISRVLDMVFVLKALERVGDHANHIAQQVIFVAEGRDVRYVSPETLEGSTSVSTTT
jgi:phosphate transport system protein